MKFIKRLEDLFAATAFAEEGDFESAREIASGVQTSTRGSADLKNVQADPRRNRARRWTRSGRSRAA